MQDLWRSILDLISKVVIPDWGEVIRLIPLGLLAVVALYFLWVVRSYATAGPVRRAPARVSPIAPPALHMPGPSYAPILAAVGMAALFWGLVVGGTAAGIGATVLVATLLYWGREAIRDYDRDTHVETLPAVIHGGPPPGVHMPGPSFRPLLGALGTAALMAGLVFGGWVLAAGVIILVVTLTGWLPDAKAEYAKTVEADVTGHLENIPAPHWPRRMLQAGILIFTLAALAQAGILPPRASEAAVGPAASAQPSAAGAPPSAGAGSAQSPAPSANAVPAVTAFKVVAKNLAFEPLSLTVPANTPFTIAFDNQDPPRIDHDVDIFSADQSTKDADTDTVPGGTQVTYRYQGLPPGRYIYICSVHPIPQMTGTLIVK